MYQWCLRLGHAIPILRTISTSIGVLEREICGVDFILVVRDIIYVG